MINSSLKLPIVDGRLDFDLDTPEFTQMPLAALFMGDDTSGPVALFFSVPPGSTGPAHFHECDSFSIVLRGSLKVGDEWFGPGSVRAHSAASVEPDVLVGPEGATGVLVLADRRGAPDQYIDPEVRESHAANVEAMGRFSRREITLDELMTMFTPTDAS